MANPSGRSFRVIDTTHLAAVAVLQAEIGAGNELVERPEMAESGPSFSWFSSILNDRFREKRTFSLRLVKSGRRTTALHPEADIPVTLR